MHPVCDRTLSYLQSLSPIHLLLNQKAVVGEIEIVGIDYNRRRNHLSEQLKTLPLNKNKFSILAYHEPVQTDVAVNHGFDLILYGHTHGGQIWPYTHLVDWIYPFGDGLFKVDNSTIYTSDGVSLWGPRMRLGSQNEIVIFNLLPE